MTSTRNYGPLTPLFEAFAEVDPDFHMTIVSYMYEQTEFTR